jgi:hypothetical protein
MELLKVMAMDFSRFDEIIIPVIEPAPGGQWTYIAGLFDGEGFVGIVKNKKGRQLFLAIEIGNCNLAVLQFIQKIAGGRLTNGYMGKEAKHPYFRLRFSTNNGKNFLKQIYPYLISKKEQARMAIEFQEQMKEGKRTMSAEKQLQYYSKIKELNAND